jgi:hypothetical protein
MLYEVRKSETCRTAEDNIWRWHIRSCRRVNECMTFIDSVTDWCLQLQCRTFAYQVVLCRFCSCVGQHFSCISCVTQSSLPSFQFFKLHIVALPSSVSSSCFVASLFLFLKYIPVFGHMSLILLETIFIIPVSGSILVNFLSSGFVPALFRSFASQGMAPSSLPFTHSASPLVIVPLTRFSLQITIFTILCIFLPS